MIQREQIHQEVTLAQERLEGVVRKTPLQSSSWLTGNASARALLKLENEQVSGSFKFRGAVNKAIAAKERGTQTLCTASTGNHAIALAHACALVGLDCQVLLTKVTGRTLIPQFRDLDVVIELLDGDIYAAELQARSYHNPLQGIEYVSPYNDLEVIAGHSTLGVELVADIGTTEIIHAVVATGGGGLAAGLKLGFKHMGGKGLVHSVAPEASPVLARGVKRGWLIEEEIQNTICHATAGNIELDSITLALCTELVDSWTTVREIDIVSTLDKIRQEEGLRIDGSAATAIAGSINIISKLSSHHVLVAVVCGTDRHL